MDQNVVVLGSDVKDEKVAVPCSSAKICVLPSPA